MEVIYNNNQIINIGAVEVIKVEKENDYIKVSVLKRTKFKWESLVIDQKFASVEGFLEKHSSKFLNIKDELYINISRILFIERQPVENTIDTFDITIHLSSGEPFALRTTSSFYELIMRRMREG